MRSWNTSEFPFPLLQEPLQIVENGPPVPDGFEVPTESGTDRLKILVQPQQLRIRLAHFDAPELGQTFGKRAKQLMSALSSPNEGSCGLS